MSYILADKLVETADLAFAANQLATFAESPNASVTCKPSDLVAREHYALAVAALKQAETHFKLADLHETREIGRVRLGR